jgi:uncharacterized radical SAM protein YgiQ
MLKQRPISDWLPVTKKETEARGWDELDVILFSGDAYVDHPSFGTAVIGRIIENEGFRVAIVPQPNWQDDLRDFKKFGKPRLFFGVTAGCMDSMVNHYTANKRKRSNDAYTPGGQAGFRPDYATTVYSKILKKLFPETPVLIGGVEASLRRLTHYDYWSNMLKPSVLEDSGADMLLYGMAEQALKEILKLLDKGAPIENLNNINQTAFLSQSVPDSKIRTIELSSHDTCLKDKKAFARNFKHIEEESNKWNANRLVQKVNGKYVVVNPPFPPMDEKEIDASFDLPYTRLPHPKYQNKGTIPAYEMIRHSVNMHRGCFGGCSFCTISAHQGKFIASRSKESIMKEVDEVTKMPDFKGYISDLGGPSANMYKMEGIDLEACKRCKAPSCIFPVICPNLDTSHLPMLDIYKEVREKPEIKKAFVGSGIRYDLFIENDKHKYFETIVKHHVSGRLKVAPEHTSEKVLRVMRKPKFSLFYNLKKEFDKASAKAGKNQQLIPYFISSHPGSEMEDMAELAAKTKELGFKLEQVQDFTPTPMTVATVIYYSGYHPYTLEKVYTPRSSKEKIAQQRFFFWYKKENRQWIHQTLNKINRPDLVKVFEKQKPRLPKKKPTGLG